MSDRLKDARDYNRIKVRLKLVDLFLIVIYLAFFQAFLSAPLKNASFALTPNFYLAFSFYLIIFSFLYYAFNLPLHFYSSFMLEHKFNLSRQNLFNWLMDEIKGGVLSLILFLVFVHALYFLMKRFDMTWWAWMALFWFLVTIIIAKVTPVLVIPLFFKYSPVTEGLRSRIMALAAKCGMKIINVYKIDFSKKTRKLNAAVVGLGNTRRVILADNLINEFTSEEVEGVLAHEFGHHELRHIQKTIVFGIITTFLSFYILYVASSQVASFFGVEGVSDITIFPSFMLILFVMSFLILPAQNGFSRALERSADLFALRTTGDKETFISLMRKLADKNLADPDPPKIIKFLFYSHPPISERIDMARKFNGST